MEQKITSHHILGMRLDDITPQEGVETVIGRAAKNLSGYCCVPNVHMCIEGVDDPVFLDVINSAALNWSDSTILQKAQIYPFWHRSMKPVLKGVGHDA